MMVLISVFIHARIQGFEDLGPLLRVLLRGFSGILAQEGGRLSLF